MGRKRAAKKRDTTMTGNRLYDMQQKASARSDNTTTARLNRQLEAVKSSPLLKAGELVKLDVGLIKGRSDYQSMAPNYREFVESHENDTFTVMYDVRYGANPVMVYLKEDPYKFLFWVGDLIKVGGEENQS